MDKPKSITNEKELEVYKVELERIKKISPEFFAEYALLCGKHKAQIIPQIIHLKEPASFKIQLVVAPYLPNEKK